MDQVDNPRSNPPHDRTPTILHRSTTNNNVSDNGHIGYAYRDW